MGENENSAEERPASERWSRRVTADEPAVPEQRLSLDERARIAERAKLASEKGTASRPRVSVRRIDENPSLERLTMDPVEEPATPGVVVPENSDALSGSRDIPAPPPVPASASSATQVSSDGSITLEEADAVIDVTDDASDDKVARSAKVASTVDPATEVIDLKDEDWPPLTSAETVASRASRAASSSQDAMGSRSSTKSKPSTSTPSETASNGASSTSNASAPTVSGSTDSASTVSASKVRLPAATSSPPPPSSGTDLARPQISTGPEASLPMRVVVDDSGVQRSRRTARLLLMVATGLALVSGVLGALWLGERSTSEELRSELELADATDVVALQGLEELGDEVQTLELENERLQEQLNDMSALVLELPEGRVTEVDVPFTPTFADEENGRLIAISAEGEYVTFAEGAAGPITDSGSVSGAPTGLFAATRKAWIATESGQIDVLSLVAGEEGLPSVEVGATSFLAPEERGYWTFDEATGDVVRRKKSDSAVTDEVDVPVDVVDLTIGAGSVWALGDDGAVYRINTADLTVSPLEAGVDLVSVTAGPDALWTLSAADGSLRRLDPVTGDVLVTVPVGRDPIDAVFAGRSVWVVLRSGSSLIEVDTTTAAVVSRTPLSGEPVSLHQGDSGVYVTTTDPDNPLLFVASLTPTETRADDEAAVDAILSDGVEDAAVDEE